MKMSEKEKIEDESEVQKFYRGANVFVTGGSGFMGKVLVEKLLWSCPGIDTIYLLLRSNRDKTVQERVEELASSPFFERLRERRPGFEAKLVAVPGDIGEKGLGLSDHHRHLLAEHVTIVFHVAATVRFEELLATAIKHNVRATRDLLALCRTCPRLKAVVHFSTIFANYPLPNIREQFHGTVLDCDQLIEMVEELSENVMNSKTKQLLGDLPNTYVLTKGLAEQVIHKHGKGLPIVISRPSIVLCSNAEPASGWIDNFSGPSGTMAAVAAGIVRTFNIDGNAFANLVPCDMAINSVVVAAWEVGEKRSISQGVPIYNFISPTANRVTWRQYVSKYTQEIREAPPINALWYPYCVLLANRHAAVVVRFLLHILPARLIEAILKFQGKPTRMCSTYAKIHKYADVTGSMGSRPWHHEERNVPALWALASARDKELFPFDMRVLDWDSFVRQSYLGMRKFLLKENEDTIPAAKIRLRRMFWVHWVALSVPMILLCWTASCTLNTTEYC